MGELHAEFIPVTDVKIGDRLSAGGIVTGIRTSASGKSVWFTMRGSRGEFEWPRESTACRTAVLTEHETWLVMAPWAHDGVFAGRVQWLSADASETEGYSEAETCEHAHPDEDSARLCAVDLAEARNA